MISAAVNALVEYNYADEEDDFVRGDHNGSLDTHIFKSLVIIEEAMKRGLV